MGEKKLSQHTCDEGGEGEEGASDASD